MDELSTNIKKSLKWYTTPKYKDFNRRMREGKELTPEQKKHKKNINNAFDVIDPIEENITVYRGLKINDPKDFQQFDKGFVSTSLEIEVTENFVNKEKKCCVAEILVPKGSKALFLINISEADEAEVLLSNKKGKFKITGIQYIENNNTIINVIYIPSDSIVINSKNERKTIEKIKKSRKFSDKELYDKLRIMIEDELIMIDEDTDDEEIIRILINPNFDELMKKHNMNNLTLSTELRNKLLKYIKNRIKHSI